MKKLLTSLTALAAIFAGTAAFAQEPVQAQDQEENLLEEVFIVQNMTKGDSGTTHYHWVMSKMVTDDFQITEGLRTRGMTK